MDIRTAHDEYWSLAKIAIKDQLLTSEEATIIARVNHRKEPYWNRHLRDLNAIVLRRIKTRASKQREDRDVM